MNPHDGEDARECASCYIAIDGPPVVRDGDTYCCTGCADGASCTCTYGAQGATAESSADSTDAEAGEAEVRAAAGVRNAGASTSAVATGDRNQSSSAVSDAEKVMRDALSDAAAILQNALGKMGGGSGNALLRTIEDLKTPTYQLNIANVRDAVQYMIQLQKLAGVRAVAIVAVENYSAQLTVVTESLNDLISGTTAMRGRFRPRTWRISGSTIDIELDDSPSGSEDAPLFRLGADAFFGARHFVTMDGKKGPAHYHSWRVEVVIESRTQTSEGVVVGFAEARRLLERLVEPYNQALLNAVAPFTEQQPTAENVARHLYLEFKKQFNVESARLQLLRVWENPTNHATYSEDE